MNVFGAFSFGRLIKTFVPGFMLLAAALVFLDGYFLWRHDAGVVQVLSGHDGAALWTSAFVLCIILGLLSNTIVFAGINDLLVRNPVAKNPANKDLFDAKKEIYRVICLHYAAKFDAFRKPLVEADAPDNPAGRATVVKHFDAEYLALRKAEPANLVHVQEQYWYYMELHINLVFTLTVFAVALILRLGVVERDFLFWLPVHIVLPAVVIWFMISVAKKNYLRHIQKITSLMCSVAVDLSSERPAPGG